MHKKTFAKYPYSEHTEEGVFVRKGAHTPYKVGMFGVSSLDMDNLPSNVELSASLVRGNRKQGRVLDKNKIFKKIEDFVGAPVGVVMQVKVMDKISEKEWKKFIQIDWGHLEEIAWDQITDRAFLQYLEEKDPSLPLAVVNALNKLRVRMASLYDLDKEISSHIMEQDIIVLPVISDLSRRVRCIMPFLKTGIRT